MTQQQRAVTALLKQALQHEQHGRLEAAAKLYRRILKQQPRQADALYLLGRLAQRRGATQEAESLVRRAIAANGRMAVFHVSHAQLLTSLGQPQQALAAYDKALALQPDDGASQNARGNLLAQLGRFEEAEKARERALESMPRSAVVQFNRGNDLKQLGRLQEALAAYDAALALRPDYAEAHYNRGNTLMALGQLRPALGSYQAALELAPTLIQAYRNRGNVQRSLGDLAAALADYETLISQVPNDAEALFSRGEILTDLGRFEAAVAAYAAALAARPNYAQASAGQGLALHRLGRLDEALRAYDRALRLRPTDRHAHSERGFTLAALGQVAAAAEAFETAVKLDPQDAAMHSARLLALHYWEPRPDGPLWEAVQAFRQSFEQTASAPGFRNSADPGRRLRIGYLSGDLRRHPVGYFLAPVLAHHQRSEVEIHCFSTQSASDDLSAQFKTQVADWHSLVGLSDAEAAALIRAQEIDLLVDLAGHTAHNRLLVFAQRAAPVQLGWLGYSDTTGLPAMDYILADAVVVPEAQAGFYTEQVWRLPQSYLCYRPPADLAECLPNAHGLSANPADESREIQVRAVRSGAQGVTFGSFNNSLKLSPQTVALWSRLLLRNPDARLLLKDRLFKAEASRQPLLARFAAHGISADRLELLGELPRADHFAAYGRVDIALDPTPYGGTTTTADALWMGVPVVTLRGDTWVGRVSASILETVGLPELIAEDEEAYLRIATALAEDEPQRATLRKNLRLMLEDSPFCDGEAFTRDLEAAYRGMWRRWCASSASANDKQIPAADVTAASIAMPASVRNQAAAIDPVVSASLTAESGASPSLTDGGAFTWQAMLEGFRALGGIADNVEQREGRYGLGLFAIDPNQPVLIHTPEHLLIPTDAIQREGDELIIRPEAKVSEDLRQWFRLFQRHFSWGASGKDSVETFEQGLRDLPDALKEVLRDTGRFNLRERHGGEWDDVILRMFLRTRQFNYQGKNVTLVVLELINHEASSAGFQVANGVQVSGRFEDEVTVRYTGNDTLAMFLTYGFVPNSPLAYSLPLRVRAADGGWVKIGADAGAGFARGRVFPPKVTREGETLGLQYVVLGCEPNPALPRGLLRKALAEYPVAQADELFDRMRFANQHLLCRILQAAEAVDQPVAALLRQAVLQQLTTLAYAYGASSQTGPRA